MGFTPFMVDKDLFSDINHFSSSDDHLSEESDIFESDIYPLKGDDYEKLKEEL